MFHEKEILIWETPYGLKTKKSYMERYRDFGCANPECSFGYGLEVHHIIPVSRGGKDEYENYIILCFRCHRKSGNHRNYKQRLVMLWTYKFYFESKADANRDTLPTMPERDIQPEEIQGKDSPEVLQPEVPDILPQPSKKSRIRKPKKRKRRKSKKRLRVRSYKPAKKIRIHKPRSAIIAIRCPICGRGFRSRMIMEENKNHCRRNHKHRFFRLEDLK